MAQEHAEQLKGLREKLQEAEARNHQSYASKHDRMLEAELSSHQSKRGGEFDT